MINNKYLTMVGSRAILDVVKEGTDLDFALYVPSREVDVKELIASEFVGIEFVDELELDGQYSIGNMFNELKITGMYQGQKIDFLIFYNKKYYDAVVRATKELKNLPVKYVQNKTLRLKYFWDYIANEVDDEINEEVYNIINENEEEITETAYKLYKFIKYGKGYLEGKVIEVINPRKFCIFEYPNSTERYYLKFNKNNITINNKRLYRTDFKYIIKYIINL